jgi:hypothetical protein
MLFKLTCKFARARAHTHRKAKERTAISLLYEMMDFKSVWRGLQMKTAGARATASLNFSLYSGRVEVITNSMVQPIE